LTRPIPQLLALLDGFVLVSLLGLILLEIVPGAILQGGPIALVAVLVGVVVPPLVDRWFGDVHDAAHSTMLGLAMVGLALHAMLDGAALLTGDEQHGEWLALGVVLHRVPVGLTIWWAVRPSRGRKVAFAVVGLVALATVVGFFGSGPLLRRLPVAEMSLFQGLVAGSLLHVIFGHHPRQLAEQIRRHGGAGTIGALVAMTGLFFVAHSHPAPGMVGVLSAGDAFVALALESAPALVLAFAGGGLLHAFVNQRARRWLAGGGRLTQAGKGIAFGLPLPICSCGVLPIYRSLVTGGVPVAAALAFLVATPELGLDAVLITIPLLGAELAVARLVAASVVALVVGVLVSRGVAERDLAAEEDVPSAAPSPAERLGTALRYGFGELPDHIGPWIVAGLALAALVEPLLRDDWLGSVPHGLDVPVAAALGLPGYVCASGATPLAAILMHKGLSAGGALAFLLTGPATNVTTFAVLSSLHGRRTALLFALAVTGSAVALGYATNLWLGEHPAIPLHEHAAAPPGLLQMASLAAVALVFLGSLWRQGPRGFVGQLFGGGDHDHDHGHAHGHDNDHDHGHAHDHGHDDDHGHGHP
ncbi:MAG: permease, partial [Myxococcales bacterium]|nr:permease [Myxococcales bacterium]